METLSFDLALAPPNHGGEELALMPRLLSAQALRHRYLATWHPPPGIHA
jgi:hypothetical protein